MKEVENFFNTYVTNILNGNDITIEPKRLVNLKDLTGNAKMNALKKSIEKHPENLIFYLNDKELDVTTKPCSISRINNYTFRIILTQGLNRQIRRMCQESGYKVESLTRVRIMNIELGGLKIGEYRIIEGKEKTMLYESL